MTAEAKLMNLATTIAKTEGISLARATAKASQQLTADEIDEYRGGTPAPAPASVKPLNVTDRPGVQALRAEADRRMREQGLSADDAVDQVLCERLPDAGAIRFSQRVMQLRSAGLDAVTAMTRASQESPADAEAYRVAGL